MSKPARHPITDEYLRERLRYLPVTGQWFRRIRSRRRNEDVLIESRDKQGYGLVMIDGRHYRSHILAWFWMTGRWPDMKLDHKDTDTTNDRWVNLREATNSQNSANAKLSAANTSGRKGVCFDKWSGRWMSTIGVEGRYINLGRFDDLEEAAQAYRDAAVKYFGEFARTA